MLVLRRQDPARNVARFYCLSLEDSLFGETLLVARWGRIGTHGRRQSIAYEDTRRANEALSERLLSKLRRGYETLGHAPS
jgi:predicted DNA-binding WGR domain protein